MAAAKHGSGTTASSTDVYDPAGRLVWSRDAAGYLRYSEYDPATGAVIKRISDVDTTETSDFDATWLPAGWSTPAGGGAHLTTTSETDSLGRTFKTTAPDGRVTYTVYLESAAATETRTYRGWHDTGGGVYATTGPVEVYRHDRDHNYTESLTFSWSGAAGLPTDANGRPTGAESLASADATIESLTRSLMNDAGQTIAVRQYTSLDLVSYSSDRNLGTAGDNYLQTEYTFDVHGRLAVVTNAAGADTHTFYDVLGRTIEVWAGTDDVPTTDYNSDGDIDLRDFRYWVEQNGTAPAGTDMVLVAEYEYDNGSDGGDGFMTKVTQHVDSSSTREAEHGYDWRGRQLWTYQDDGAYATYSYMTYDNVGRVTRSEQYHDADDDFSTQGPETASDDILIARSETAYDERGRVYTTTYYGVDPSDGTINATSLTTLTWYDARGNVIKSQAGGTEQFSKTVYDSLGRVISQYVGFDLDETSYAEAGNVDGDTIFAQTEYDYNAVGQTIFVTTRERLHDATGAGALNGPAGNQPKSRDSYMAYWYDELGRRIAMADYGTAGGTAMDVGDRPSAPPTRSDTVLVNSTEYDPAGLAYKQTDPAGKEQRTYYDMMGRVLKTIQNYTDGNPATGGSDEDVTVETTYTPDGQMATSTDPMGAVTTYEYDQFGRQVKITQPDPDGLGAQAAPEMEFAYNRAGELLSVTDANDETTTYEYDLLGRLTKTITPAAGAQDPAEQATVYDVLGRVHTETNPLGHSTTYAYDDFDRLASRADAENGTTAYTYDWAGNQLTLTDPAGNTTTWVYDAMNRMIEETNELNDSRQFVYDGGLLVRQVDRRRWVRQFEFDRFDRNTGEIWYNNTSDADADQNRRNTFTFTYDRLGRMLSGEDAHAAYNYVYDGLGRPVQITQDIVGLDPQIVVTAEYDAAGRRTQVAAAIGGTADFVTDYTYDNAGRIDTIKQQSQQGGNAVSEKYVDFVFDVANRPSQLSRYGNLAGTKLVAHTDYVFDEVGRLTDLTHAKGGTTFADYDLVYDLAGRLTAFDFTSLVGNAGDAAFSHDDTGQLTDADYSSDWQDDEDYVYDENGNRITAGGATYVTGANNRLLSDGTYRYAYDEEGNRTLRFVDADQSGTLNAGDSDITQFTWDHRNRLTKVAQFADYTDYTAEEPGQVVEYAYDFGQRWVRKVLDENGNGTADASSIFVHDNGQIVLEFERAGTGDATAADLARRYLWGPAVDQLLAQETVDDGGSEDVLWALTDHLNSVRDLAQYDEGADTTTIARHLVYDAFGNLTSDTAPAVTSLFLYTARPFDEHTGLQNNLNRWYDTKVGRWLSEDAIGFEAGDENLYRYVGNEPLLSSDPSGLWLRVSGSIWMAEKDDTSFDDLVAHATNGRLPAKNRVLIHPFAPSLWSGLEGLGGGDMWREMREAWERQEPAPCAFYDVGNLTDDWPSGGELMFSVGTDQNRYIQAASLFYMIPGTHYSLTAIQAIGLIEAQSNRGATPIKKLTIIGHSWRDKVSIGGTGGQPGGRERFNIDLFGKNVAGDPPWPSWEDARARNLHPLGWFRTDAEVRFVGCMTSLFASRFASALLRPGATAHGTTRATWAPSWPHDGATLDNPFPHRWMGWGTGTSPATWGFDTQAGTALSPEVYHKMKYWMSFPGGG